MKKVCRGCETKKSISEFYLDRTRKYDERNMGVMDICKLCSIKNKMEHYIAHRDSSLKVQLSRHKFLRDNFLEVYGNECDCCGESHKEFLTIEHVKGQTKSTKESSGKAYRKAIKEFGSGNYKILCMNCNHSKGKYGYCPHQSS